MQVRGAAHARGAHHSGGGREARTPLAPIHMVRVRVRVRVRIRVRVRVRVRVREAVVIVGVVARPAPHSHLASVRAASRLGLVPG